VAPSRGRQVSDSLANCI